MKRKKLGIATLCILLVCTALFFAYQRVENFAGQSLAIEEETIFTLPAGTGRAVLQTLLEQEQLVARADLLPWLLKLRPELGKFKAGTYRLTPGITVEQMLLLLASGKEAQFSIRFIEGTRLSDWRQLLQQTAYVDHQLADKSDEQIAGLLGIENVRLAEGWLYPDTYFFTAGTSDVMLLERAHQRMQKALDEAWQRRDPDLPYKTPLELLTMASIIEKETAVNDERTKVASVFVNRLRIGMRLQTDPTVIYGMGDRYRGSITRKDLDTATAYNTYVISGLPPTPIAAPGRASLEAAAHPAKTTYLYFVADGKGGHTFTSNLASHNKAVRVYREALKKKNEQ